MTSIAIIIPLFGPEYFLIACLKAIVANTPEPYHLVIVDNATGYELFDAPGLATVIRNPENRGFAVGCNQGANVATEDILCFLNVDTEVQSGWLGPLLVQFDDPDVAMCGPRIVHPTGDLQTSGIRTWHGGGAAGGEEIKEELPSRDVDGVTGACMAIRRDVFNGLGQFDTDFINGYEDVSMCLSVREATYRIRYVAESLVVHHESAAGGADRWKHASQNVQTMNTKWGNR